MLKSKRLQIVNRWLVTKAAKYENCRIAFPGQAFPEGLKKHMPDLYEALSHVLNQDPKTKTKLLKSEL